MIGQQRSATATVRSTCVVRGSSRRSTRLGRGEPNAELDGEAVVDDIPEIEEGVTESKALCHVVEGGCNEVDGQNSIGDGGRLALVGGLGMMDGSGPMLSGDAMLDGNGNLGGG